MYLLLWLLDLRRNPSLARWTRIFAIANATFMGADGIVCALDWSNPHLTLFCQWSDGILTVLYSLTELWPVVLVLFAIRSRLDTPRWLVAIFACLSQLSFFVPITLEQGNRFTHWTLGHTLLGPLFTLLGNGFDLNTLANFGLLVSIFYAVFAYSRRVLIRKQTMEQELRSAQELLQVLIPEALPSLKGFALTSAYRPAAEVGGDFFQILPVADGTSVVAIGDVSGKGLRAAMAVSLIVGALRTLVETDPAPAAILAGLNRRLHNRLQGGFATCLILRLDAEGLCALANAGHPAPFLNGREVSLGGSLPLGVSEDTSWEESRLQLQIQDQLVPYTDGLLEARNERGEIFGFDRLAALLANRLSAEQALAAAQAFGQEDDITVLTLARLAVGEKATAELIAPVLVPA
jgi:phosphoserine phosphatase RsbU/P